MVLSKLHPAQQSWNEKNPKNIHEANMASETASIVCLWTEMQLTFPLPLRSSWLLNFFWGGWGCIRFWESFASGGKGKICHTRICQHRFMSV
jgi:hypothetical protein